MGATAVGILVVLGVVMVVGRREVEVEGATWCIARSGASATALQSSLDYACGAGGDCLPIQESGLCYLPNTLPAHASYAFNSYYQRSNAAPGSCDFAGTGTVTVTDPSFGSCTYPSSKRFINAGKTMVNNEANSGGCLDCSTAGGSTGNTPSTNAPTNTPINTPPVPGIAGGTNGGVGGLSPPGLGTTLPNCDASGSFPLLSLLLSTCICFFLLLI